jgi:hypothetical protein
MQRKTDKSQLRLKEKKLCNENHGQFVVDYGCGIYPHEAEKRRLILV